MANKNILPQMVSVSRNCRLTSELHQKIVDKLDDSDIEDFRRWLRIIEDETRISINNKRRY